MAKARDAIAAAFNQEKFSRLVERCRAAQGDIIQSPKYAVDQIVKGNELTEAQADSILQHFLGDYDATRWGVWLKRWVERRRIPSVAIRPTSWSRWPGELRRMRRWRSNWYWQRRARPQRRSLRERALLVSNSNESVTGCSS